MRIQYCSDLHLEFIENVDFLKKNPIIKKGEILILAGDIIPLNDDFYNNPILIELSKSFNHIFWVPGNHEYYHSDINKFGNSFNIKVNDNISLVNNVSLMHNGLRFIFSTLWSKIEKENEKLIEQRISDYYWIKNRNKYLKVEDTNKLNEESLNFIIDQLKTNVENTIIVSHHLPSDLCNAPEHKNSAINSAFCTDYTSFISKCNAKFWIYGHSHFNQKPLYIGNTILLTNQLGYIKYKENKNFNRSAYISI